MRATVHMYGSENELRESIISSCHGGHRDLTQALGPDGEHVHPSIHLTDPHTVHPSIHPHTVFFFLFLIETWSLIDQI